MIKSYFAFLFLFIGAVFLLIDDASASTWEDLNSVYIDTDSDGEKDDFIGYDVNDRIDLVDVLEEFESYPTLGITFLTLRSDPENQIVFGNTLDSSVRKGKGIILDVRIIKDTETDGDDMETYDIMSVMVLTGGDSTGTDDNDGDSSSDSDPVTTALTIAICCFPQIVAPIIIIAVVLYNKKKKREKAEQLQTTIQPQNTPAYRSSYGNQTQMGWNHNTTSQPPPRTAPPPPDTTSEDDMKGLEDFIASMKNDND